MTMRSTKWSVQDGATRKIEFDGQMLGEVSSRRSGAPRWTELRLYRSDSGIFVLEKVGRSVVLHAPDCREILPDANLPRFQTMHPGEDPADGSFWFCESCGRRAASDITSMLIEADRHWALVSETPEEIVDSLYRRKGGAKSLPRMSIDLLEEASAVSPELLSAYQVEVI
ncbi:MAG TPA: hypothetical protein VIQ02_09075 [Jiangellaceae bacterium]